MDLENAPGCRECDFAHADKCEGYGCAGDRYAYVCEDHGVLVRRTIGKFSATFRLCLDCYQADRNSLGDKLTVIEGRELAAAMHLELGESLPADLKDLGGDRRREAA